MIETNAFVPKTSTGSQGKSRNDRFFSGKKPLPQKIKSAFTAPKKPLSKPTVPKVPTVRVIMHSGVVHANGQHPGKERQIPFRAVSLA